MNTKDYFWDFNLNKLFFQNNQIYLNENETKICTLLLKTPYRVLTYIEIVDKLWNDNISNKKEELIFLIRKLEKKLPSSFIEESRGLGYKIKHKSYSL
ncbi:MAG: winged helix-turn-helix domain-containing protein [Arcobacter sp.]|uniref:winged helix-turn-helix domain-containing protein n=1 Tax=Arcobacter sp. TaxID=1872629 RepID=UPI003AFFFB23